ncbi:MAG: adenylosuccinate lyase [Bernardetiaceae bacterium]
MDLSALTAISPVDGRYREKTLPFARYFSEFGLMKYRVQVEVEYFIALTEIPLPQLSDIPRHRLLQLREAYTGFRLRDAQAIKDIERTTNHDVKAVEYFLKEKFDALGLSAYKEFIHFGLTSQDINNTAIPMLLRDALKAEFVPTFSKLLHQLERLSQDWKNIPLLAHTHGQPASPTRLGKEIEVFLYRLREQSYYLNDIPYVGKFGGATGNFNAHHVAYPEVAWNKFADVFLGERLSLKRAQRTTQIENYDHLAALLDALRRLNVILIDFARDIWAYISMGYFGQKIKSNEVGSSAMPHKVNPIDFENAEGNLDLANALFGFLSEKLPISRLQRDLTDSTVLRNIGLPITHTYIALLSLLKGIDKLEIHQEKIDADLANNWAVVAEALQTILRREGYPKPYETLKKLTRTSEKITAETIRDFIAQLNVSQEIKEQMYAITPFNYTGI